MALAQTRLPGNYTFAFNSIRMGFNENSTFVFFRITVQAKPAGGAYSDVAAWVEYPNATNGTDFRVDETLRGLFAITLPAHDLDDDYSQQYFIWKVKCDTIDTDGNIVHTTTTAEYTTFWGGINFQKYRYGHFFGNYMPSVKKLFTWQPNNQKVDTALRTYATYILLSNASGKNAKLNVKLYYDSGLIHTITPIAVAPDAFAPTVVPTGFDLLDLHSHETGGLLIVKYEVFIADDDGDLTEHRTYYVDRNYYRQKKYFTWLNSLGGFDAILCTGVYIEEFEYTGDEGVIYVPYNYDWRNGERKPSDHYEQGMFTCATGWKTKAEIDHLRDALLTLLLAEDDGEQFLPIKIERGTIRTLQSDQKLFALQFKYKQLFRNQVYTSAEYDNTLLSGSPIDLGGDTGDDGGGE